MRDDLSAAFHALSQYHAASQLLMLSHLSVDTAAGKIAAAVDHDGTRHLLLPIPIGTPVATDRRSRSVTIERRELIVDGERCWFIDVACQQPALNDLFERLAVEICERVAAEPEDYLVIPGRTLSRWRQLLEAGKEPLTPGQVVGLFGELWVLREMVAEDPLRRVDHWVGPDNAVHDFRRGRVAVEVKTSTTRNGRIVEIHGADQLAVAASDKLILVYLRVREASEGINLRKLVTSLEAQGVDPVSLRGRLNAAGVPLDLNSPSYEVIEERWFTVRDSFPRIIPDSFLGGRVPEGILSLSYRLDLTGPEPVPLEAEARSDILKEMAAT
ncbi:PD-(D/E)XK motif protein [Blastococcus sp. SYSU DS0533]